MIISLEMLTSLVSLFVGLISLVGIVYAFGVKLSGMSTKIDFLWRVHEEFTLSNLRSKGFVESGSPDHVTEKFMNKYRGKIDFSVRKKLEQISKSRRYSDEPANLTMLIVKTLGNDFVSERSSELGLPIGDYLTLLATSTRWAHEKLLKTGKVEWPPEILR